VAEMQAVRLELNRIRCIQRGTGRALKKG